MGLPIRQKLSSLGPMFAWRCEGACAVHLQAFLPLFVAHGYGDGLLGQVTTALQRPLLSFQALIGNLNQ